MDDDLQNPPDQALLLIDEAMTGKDVVFGRVRAQAGRRLPPARQQADQHDQPPGLRPARPTSRSPTSGSCAATSSTGSAPPAPPTPTSPARRCCTPATAANVTGAPRAPPGRQEQLQHGAGSCGWCSTILFSYSSFPLRLAAAGRLRDLRGSASCSARSTCSAALFGDTHVQGWTTIGRCCSSVFNGFTIALLSMLGEYVVRTLNAVSAQDTLPRHGAGAGVTPAPAGRSAPSAAARPTCTTCWPPTPRSRWRGRRGPSRRCSSPTELAGRGLDWYRADLLRPRRPTSRCSARRAPATSSTPRPPTARPRCSATRWSWSQLRDPVRAGGVALARSAPTTGSRPRRWPRRSRANLDGPAAWDPGAHVGLAVRLPRAGPLRRLPRALAGRGSATTCTCCSSRSCWTTRGASRDAVRARSASTRASGRPTADAGQREPAAAPDARPTTWSRGCASTSATSDLALSRLLGRPLPWWPRRPRPGGGPTP